MVANKTGATRLGFAVLLKFFAHESRFPESADEVPVEVVAHLADQVGVRWQLFGDYRWQGRTIELHRAQIRGRFGFRPATDDDVEVLTAWLVDEVAVKGTRPERLTDAVLDRCRRDRVEPPSAGRVARLVGSARRRFDDRFARLTVLRLPAESRRALDALLEVTAPAEGAGPGRSCCRRSRPIRARSGWTRCSSSSTSSRCCAPSVSRATRSAGCLVGWCRSGVHGRHLRRRRRSSHTRSTCG